MNLSKLHRWLGIIPSRVKVPLRGNGKDVVFLHNPKAAGSSLKMMLGYEGNRTLHIRAHDCFSRRNWHNSFVISAVREPYARFVSGYNFHVKSDYVGYLHKTVGPDLKNLSPAEYFEVMKQFPSHLGKQHHWCYYPDVDKPLVDLILKVEEAGNWVNQLRSVGIEPSGELVKKNNGPAKAAPLQVTKDFAHDFLEYHAMDYRLLGYEIPQSLSDHL